MINSKTTLAVGLGGIIGATSRYIIAEIFPQTNNFPTATLFINLIGCFLLSYILFLPALKRMIKPSLLTGLTTGIIGSFTTFSTVMIEIYDLGQTNIILAMIYLFISIFGGLLCCYIGFKLARRNDIYD